MSASNTMPVSFDFDNNMGSLRAFLQSQDEFKDYDYEGSAMSELLRVMAFNEQTAAFRNNFMFNEMDIRSADLYENVASIASAYSYIPTGNVGAIIPVDIVVTPDNITTAPNELTLQLSDAFYSAKDGISYTFYPLTNSTVPLDSTSGTYTFSAINLKQGQWVYNSYVIQSQQSVESFEIPNQDIDITTLKVSVFPSPDATTFALYQQVQSGYDLGAVSNVYFLRQNRNKLYEIEFGDGTLANKPTFGSVVVIQYMISSGVDGNNINSVSPAGSIQGYYNISVTPTNGTSSYGGAAPEDIESIRQSAPLVFQTVGNAVSDIDYAALTKKLFTEAADVISFGGDLADPPKFGYTLVCVKPTNSLTLTSAQKDNLVSMLSKMNVGSITPIVTDPEYVYIDLSMNYSYSVKNTILTKQALDGKVKTALNTYATNKLGGFSKNFYYSDLIGYTNNIDKSIKSFTISTQYRQRFIPILNVVGIYKFNFHRSIQKGTISINNFRVSDIDYTGFTYKIIDDSNGNLNLIKTDGVNTVTISSNIGLVDYTNGIINLSAFNPNSIIGDMVDVIVYPDTLDQSLTGIYDSIINFGNISIDSVALNV